LSRIIEAEILIWLENHPASSSSQIHEVFKNKTSLATVKRLLGNLVKEKKVVVEGKAKNSRYRTSPDFSILAPVDIESYYKKEIDERRIKENFQFDVIQNILPRLDLFTNEEKIKLEQLHKLFQKHISDLTSFEYQKEMERLAIDLSWKSSQIEGNTYSLLETERLLKDKETAAGKPQSDAIMLLNHKEAIQFIIEQKDYLEPLKVRGIEDIHSILVKDLGIDRNIRKRRVGISGTNYTPLDNEFQIREALEEMCLLINTKTFVPEKALLTLVLLSYIQPFADGNKRTARITSNSILLANDHCPLSFRTVDSTDYKKAMLIFYEQNNISAIKSIFIEQYEFAIKTYF